MTMTATQKNESPLWQRILVPTDFSAPADAALSYAVRLALVSEAVLHVGHVVPVPHVLDPLYERGLHPPESLKRIWSNARRHIKTIIGSVADGEDATVRIHFAEGDAIEGLLAWTEKLKPDLIVIGTHGRTGTQRFFMGSVAEAIVRRAPCPVLTVRGAERATT